MTAAEKEAADEATHARKRRWARENKVTSEVQREQDRNEIANLRSWLAAAQAEN